MARATLKSHRVALEIQLAVIHAAGLAISCLISYWAVTYLLARALSVSKTDDLLGGMWAVIATVFVYRTQYQASVAAALSRLWATFMSFVLCQAYLLIFPFSPWGLVTLIGMGSLILTLARRHDAVVTAGITTAVVMVVAALSPDNAQLQPMLRVIDTLVGVAVGIAAVMVGRLQYDTIAKRTGVASRGADAES